MATIFTSTWDVGNQSEWGGTFGIEPPVEAASARDGAFGMSLDNGANTGVKLKDVSASGHYNWFLRFYLRINVANDGEGGIAFFQTALTGGATPMKLALTADRTLKLYANGSSQVGSDSSVLAIGQWYRVEVHMDATPSAGSDVLELRLNGDVQATASNLTITGAGGRLTVGEESTAGANHDYDIDTLALSDSEYPGPFNENGFSIAFV